MNLAVKEKDLMKDAGGYLKAAAKGTLINHAAFDFILGVEPGIMFLSLSKAPEVLDWIRDRFFTTNDIGKGTSVKI
ncbi:MAG: hypothetical protein R2681_03700 [Pyrinomonadaceae bacterium]